MFQIDEKVIKDSRTLITIQGKKQEIEPLTKNGTINYTMNDDNLWLTTPKVRKAYITRDDTDKVYDKIVLARDGKNIDGNYTFLNQLIFNDNIEMKKNLVVRGNLTVEGKSTVIDTPSLTIEDNIIELNKNETGEGVSLKIAGTSINRGTLGFARYLFSDNDKAFILDTNESIDGDVNSSSWVVKGYAEKTGGYEAGEFVARKRLTAPFGKFTDSLTVSKQTTLNNLIVNGTTQLKSDTTAANITINGSMIANSSAEFNGLLTANKAATFNDNVTTNSALNVKNISTFDEKATFNKGIEIQENGAAITGDVDITGELNVTENTRVQKDLTVVANIDATNITASATTKTKDINVTKNANIAGNLNVTGMAEVSALTVLNGGAEINKRLDVSCESNINNNLNVRDNVNIKGQLNVKSNTVLEGYLQVADSATIEGDATINGSLNVPNSPITTTTVNANNVKISSSNGNGIGFWNSNNYKIYMSSATDTTFGGRLDTTSDYNMYFKMSGGTNRGFVFKSGDNPLFQIESTGQVRTVDKIICKDYEVLTRENEGHKTDATGINADKLDNLHASSFLRRNTDTNTTANLTFTTEGKGLVFADNSSIINDTGLLIKAGDTNSIKMQDKDGNMLLNVTATDCTYKNQKIWHKGNDGSGSGLDADLLDGKQASYFSEATHNHDDRYIMDDEVDLGGKYRIEFDEDTDSLNFMYIGG